MTMSESSSDQELEVDVDVDVENSDQELNISLEETEFIKKALLKHPLFPLLALLFEKCELATMTCGAEPDNEKLEREFMEFAQSTKEWSAGEGSIDQLMLESLQVLRIHLGELQKVNELCNNFCQRYIRCLRDKMHSSNLLKDAHFDVDDSDDDQLSNGSAGETENSQEAKAATVGPPPKKVTRSMSVSRSTPNPNQSSSSTRGVLPKQATELMRAWLFAHIVHPYPSEEEKKIIAQQTNLSLLQVNNWFINARRRILQPMLDSQNSQKA
ncbi:homeobox protein PKNOX2 [Galendromus occidentalis]|uniref:Homeobox protein PKNOX2 n=1 Tax=Galendromus occidentalis TaxID=34638 RepID=A0AAJ6QVX3_9ACAR|nr:homeobox protein PKNOX2 [Galendromus occidentalis]